MPHYYGILSRPSEVDALYIPASPSDGSCLTGHPSGAAKSYEHKAWACPPIASTPAGAASRLAPEYLPGPSRVGPRADVMGAITFAWDEARRAQEAACRLADTVKLAQAAEVEALKNQLLMEARLGALRAAFHCRPSSSETHTPGLDAGIGAPPGLGSCKPRKPSSQDGFSLGAQVAAGGQQRGSQGSICITRSTNLSLQG
eukprot:16449367-Heterocapsa_arctica.AAC.1